MQFMHIELNLQLTVRKLNESVKKIHNNCCYRFSRDIICEVSFTFKEITSSSIGFFNFYNQNSVSNEYIFRHMDFLPIQNQFLISHLSEWLIRIKTMI